uniref:Uncharacterized protein n=1 Tax=Oryza punctata TaxID=4537 RepID=A0A0E0KFA9_ORYPU
MQPVTSTQTRMPRRASFVNLFPVLHEWALPVAEKEPSHWHERQQQQKLVTSIITKVGKTTAITTRDTYGSYRSTSKANKIELLIFRARVHLLSYELSYC